MEDRNLDELIHGVIFGKCLHRNVVVAMGEPYLSKELGGAGEIQYWMQHNHQKCADCGESHPSIGVLPAYSETWDGAGLVVAEMGDCLHLREHGTEGEWEASFCGFPGKTAHAETAPRAICLAALKTRGIEV